MKKIILVVLLSSICLTSYAWNLEAKHINALAFNDNGVIKFTLFNSGSSGPEFKCSGTNPWFVVNACNPATPACLSATNRMASMVLAAKASGKKLHVQRSGCTVSQTALKPN